VYDPETGLYYLRSRYYYSYLYRFVNEDSVIVDKNVFSYCNCSPVNFTDEDGLFSWEGFTLPWPGAVHDQVQTYICSTNPNYVKNVAYIVDDNQCFIDLVDVEKGTCWELKSASCPDIGDAVRQLFGYLGCSAINSRKNAAKKIVKEKLYACTAEDFNELPHTIPVQIAFFHVQLAYNTSRMEY